MGNWHYQVYKHKNVYKIGKKTFRETYYEIHEEYDNVNGGKIHTIESVKPIGNSLDELRSTLVMMLNDTFRFPPKEYKEEKKKEKKKRK